MANIIALRIFADEYLKILKQLLSNQHFIAMQKKDAFAKLATGYKELTKNFDATSIYQAAVRTALFSDAQALTDAIAKVPEKEGGGDEELICRLLQKKIMMIEDIFKEHNIFPIVKEKSIDFKNGKGDVVMSYSLVC